MRKKRVWRYYCDFCSKGRCQAHAIAKHEVHCTKNPNRECAMCELRGLKPRAMNVLKSTLKGGFIELLAITENCPACILATVRQSNSTCDEYEWSYHEACEQFWKDLKIERENEAQQEILAEMFGS